MTTRKKTIQVPASTREIDDGVYCDKCGEDFPKRGIYESRDSSITMTSGTSFPDGGSMAGWEVQDLCETCSEWLKSLLIEHGVTITEIDEDW